MGSLPDERRGPPVICDLAQFRPEQLGVGVRRPSHSSLQQASKGCVLRCPEASMSGVHALLYGWRCGGGRTLFRRRDAETRPDSLPYLCC